MTSAKPMRRLPANRVSVRRRATPVRARTVARNPQGMNKSERRYAEHLDLMRLAGEIRAWRFEAVKFRLAKSTWYTPDFEIVYDIGLIAYHDVKGTWGRGDAAKPHSEDDAKVKIKVVAETFPDRMFCVAWFKRGDGWLVDEVTP